MKLEDIPDEMPGGIMFHCLIHEKPEMLVLLIKKGANPEHVGRMGTPLQTAAIRGDVPMVKALIEVGANINVEKTPLRWAAEFGLHGTGGATAPDYCGVMDILLDQDKINVNDGDTPSLLYLVARQCENSPEALRIFDKLVGKGAQLSDLDMESSIHSQHTLNKDWVEKFLKKHSLL